MAADGVRVVLVVGEKFHHELRRKVPIMFRDQLSHPGATSVGTRQDKMSPISVSVFFGLIMVGVNEHVLLRPDHAVTVMCALDTEHFSLSISQVVVPVASSRPAQ